MFVYGGCFALGGAFHTWKGSEPQGPLVVGIIMFAIAAIIAVVAGSR